MSAKKRAANQMAEARRQQAVAESADSGKKPYLMWLVTALAGLLILFIIYKKFIDKPYVKPLDRIPPPVEKTNWQSLVDGQRAMQSVKRLVDIGPRVAGTDGSVRAQQMIKAELGAAGIADVREQKFTDATPKGDKTFTNLIGVLPGKRTEGIGLAAHYDSKLFEDFPFVGANDAASAVAVLFELARKLKEGAADRELSYYFIFFDGEEAFLFDWRQWERETGKPDHTYGSRHMARKMDEDNFPPIKALILLDMVGDKDFSLADSPEFSKELIAPFKQASIDTFGVDFFVQPHEELGDDHDAFADKMPVIDLIDFEYGPNGSLAYWHTQEDTIDKLSPRSLELTGTLVLKALPAVEKALLKGKK